MSWKDGKVKGKVNLLGLKHASDLVSDPELIRDLIDTLDAGEMPPEKEPPLDPKSRAAMIEALEALLKKAIAAPSSHPRTPIRRMNRFQYNNAVIDLFDLKVTVFQLPERMLREHKSYFQPASDKMPDRLSAGNRPLGKSQMIEPRLSGVAAFPQDLRAEHGFDNRGDHLSLSPILMESFLKLSQSIVDSKDFGPRTVGIWRQFFVAPKNDIQTITRQRLKAFLTKAFRRPVPGPLLDRYVRFIQAQIAAGDSYTDAMKAIASATLASPRFLYQYEGATQSAPEPLNDYEIASRLSFFLWSSIPDDELLEAAAQGQLRNSKALHKQISRMLSDRKMKRFCDSFPGQWLQLDRLISSLPDRKLYKEFYMSRYRASMHMMLEPLLLFETVLIENRSILDLIDPDFSYRSQMLNFWYSDRAGKGKREVGAIKFNRVKITDRRQGGVITNAAIMTMTSKAHRSEPISRGAWIAAVIFNSPPKPPPADVPELPEEPKTDEEHLTIRERLAAHRKREDCAGCHAKIDPLGFAMENYGPTGRWRDKYRNERPVDPAGELFRKHPFSNVVEFKDAILLEKDRFTRAFAKHLLAYALGREVAASDSPALDKLVQETAADGYRLRPLLARIAMSQPFLTKYNPAESLSALPEQE